MAKTKTKGTAKTVSDTPVPQPITIRSTNPKIMADNILRLEESIKAADVSANPSGTAEDTLLSTIGIDGKKYELGPSAENTSYDNTDSGLTATNTQAAIDEINETLSDVGDVSSPAVITTVNDDTNVTDLSAFRFLFIGIYANDNTIIACQTIPTAAINFTSGSFATWLTMTDSLSDTSKLFFARLLFKSTTTINMTSASSNVASLKLYGIK